MRVTLQTHGGLTGPVGGRLHEVDSEDLHDADRAELSDLVAAATVGAAAGPDPAPGTPPPVRRPDAQTYTICVHDTDASAVLRATDGSVPPEFAALRAFLRRR